MEAEKTQPTPVEEDIEVQVLIETKDKASIYTTERPAVGSLISTTC